jgi:hypothetical protein
MWNKSVRSLALLCVPALLAQEPPPRPAAPESYLMGPGFALQRYDPDGSVFRNWPTDQNFQDRFPRHPEATAIKSDNMLDGASWSSQRQDDVMSPPPGGLPPMPNMTRNPY